MLHQASNIGTHQPIVAAAIMSARTMWLSLAAVWLLALIAVGSLWNLPFH